MAQRVKKITTNEVTSGAFYTRTVWKGRWMNYECSFCSYATLDAMKMADHLRLAHGREIADGRPQVADSRSQGDVDEATVENFEISNEEIVT